QLDATNLQSSVDSANATVATAQQRLEADETGQTSAASSAANSGGSGIATKDALVVSLAAPTVTSTAAPTTGATSSPTSGATSGPASGPAGVNGATAASGSTNTSLSALVQQIQAAQKAVVSAQQAVDKNQAGVDTAQTTVDADVSQNSKLSAAQKAACGSSSGGSSGSTSTGTQTSGSSSGASAGDCPSAQADYEAFADTLSTAMAALDKAISTQDAAVKDLDTAVSALDALMAPLQSAANSSGSGGQATNGGNTNGTGSTTRTGGTGATGGTSGTGQSSAGTSKSSSGTSKSSGSSTTTTATPASASQLAADQAAIDAANAQLVLAQQNLTAATLVSPVTGTVASVGFSVGSSSNGKSITILGTGNQVVKIAVPLSEVDQVKTGQSVAIAVDGRTDKLSGTVSKVGLLSSTAGSLTTFPVTVTLGDGSPALHNGVGADVIVTTGTASNVTVVPNSAITMLGTRHTVVVASGGKTKTVLITVGLVGADISQVVSGLQPGQQVQLADPSQALPSSATSSTTTRFGNGVFPGGGSFPAGGFRINGATTGGR
ncbi:MAG: hypothetical protein JO147_14130, partial [Actinobacteria bacterium]|nr:hypothetical protein [Actinomycetota bacterium]